MTLDDVGDTLAPGNSPGVQTFETAQTWSSFSYDWEINIFTGTTAGSDYGQVVLQDTLGLTPVRMWAGLVSISRTANLNRDSNDPTTATANTLYFGTDTVALTWAPSPFSAASHPR